MKRGACSVCARASNRTSTRNCAGDILDPWIDIRFIALRTQAIGPLIYFPFVLLGLMVVARWSVFDDWDIPIALAIVFMLAFAIACVNAFLMQRAASRARALALERLQGLQLQSKGQAPGAYPIPAHLDAIAESVRSLRKGAFVPFTEQPLVRAALIPFGSAAGCIWSTCSRWRRHEHRRARSDDNATGPMLRNGSYTANNARGNRERNAERNRTGREGTAPDSCQSIERVVELEYQTLLGLSNDARLESGSIARDQLMGLAFSGGGIRSATFNLGVLQALAELKLLKEFDYLSTVSGGGYIGSWLTAWVATRRCGEPQARARPKSENRRAVRHTPGIETVQQRLSPSLDPANEPEQIRFLRNYSNYLTPKTGLLSTDTLAAIATYLRNFILNLVILSAGLGAILLLPRVAAFLGVALQDYPVATLSVGLAALAVAVLFININLATQLPWSRFNRIRQEADSRAKDPWYVKRVWVIVTIIGSLVVSALLLACWLGSPDHDLFEFFFSMDPGTRWHALATLVGVPVAIAAHLGGGAQDADVKKEITERPTWWWRLLGCFVGAAVGCSAWFGCSRSFCPATKLRTTRSGMRRSGSSPACSASSVSPSSS
jgi:hypothetical protein